MSKSKNRPEITDQWMIKTETAKVKGPYSTDAVCKMIVEGIFSGQEDISTYPDGDWRPLSKQSEFYESLLQSLENPIERDEKNAAKMDAETIIKTSAKPDINITPEFSDQSPLIPEIQNPQSLVQNVTGPSQSDVQQNFDGLLQARDEQLTIELQQIKILQNKELKKLFPYVLAAVFLLTAIAYFFIQSNDSARSGWKLINPQKNQPVISSSQLKSYKTKAFAAIKTGNLEDLLVAQKNLVAAVEGASQDLESQGALCIVYYMLWPYTKQSPGDLKSLANVTQSARKINPISSYSDSCQAAYLVAKGQSKDARAVVEKVLDQNSEARFILFPFLYLIKADILEEQQNYLNAEAYYNEAVKAFPGWLWAQFGLGRVLYRAGKYTESRSVFEKILQINSESKAAKFGIALNEIKQNNSEKAVQFFSQGYSEKKKLPKLFHLEALQEYIKILIQKNENRRALDVATFGLTLSPSHRFLKETVITLGGDENADAANGASELVLLGDQFARVGDHLAAQAQLKAAFDLDPKNAGIALKISKSLWALNQAREAMTWLDRSLKLDPANISAYGLKADYLSQKFNFAEASKTLALATRRSPNNYEVLKAQAIIENRKNNKLSAINFGERALKIYDADVELLALLANAHVSIFLSAASRTEDEQEQKNSSLNAAQKYASKAVDLEPGWPEAQITYSKYIYASQGNVKSENYLKTLIKTYPYTLEYRTGLAEFYELQEKYKSAAEIYQQLLEADPKDKKTNFGLARCYRNMNMLSLAQKFYLAAAVLDPSDVEPLFATAQIQLDLAISNKNNAELRLAMGKFKTVRNINPNYPLTSFYIAKTLIELGLFSEASEMLTEEKTKNPGLAEPYILAAEVYDRNGQYTECAAEYSQAIKLLTTSADLYVKAAGCYRKSNALDLAQDMLDIASQRENGLPSIYREQGFVFEKKGLPRQAIEAFNRYLDLSPNAPDRYEIEKKLPR
jgi:tetratricopeptide (TPR) repeat protein